MRVVNMKSKPLGEEHVEVTMEVDIDGEIKEFTAKGETLLGAIGESFCKVIDAEVGEIENEELLLNAVSGPYGKRLVTLRLIAEHEGRNKEVVHSGEGLLESVITALRKLKDT